MLSPSLPVRPCWSCWCVARVRPVPALWSQYLSIHSIRLHWPNSVLCRSTITWTKKSAGAWTSASCSVPWMKLGNTATPVPCASSTLETPLVNLSSIRSAKININVSSLIKSPYITYNAGMSNSITQGAKNLKHKVCCKPEITEQSKTGIVSITNMNLSSPYTILSVFSIKLK